MLSLQFMVKKHWCTDWINILRALYWNLIPGKQVIACTFLRESFCYVSKCLAATIIGVSRFVPWLKKKLAEIPCAFISVAFISVSWFWSGLGGQIPCYSLQTFTLESCETLWITVGGGSGESADAVHTLIATRTLRRLKSLPGLVVLFHWQKGKSASRPNYFTCQNLWEQRTNYPLDYESCYNTLSSGC